MAEGIESHVHCGPSTKKTAQTCNYRNENHPERELGERVGKSETKENSQGKRERKCWWGKEKEKVNDNRKH